MPYRLSAVPKFLTLFLIAIFIVQIFAVKYYWYWTMRWFDMPMHFAGGVWLAGVAIWWRFFRAGSVGENMNPHGFTRFALWGIGVAFTIGLGWEIYESFVSIITTGHINDIVDTGGDLLFDVLGGLAYATYIYARMRREQDITSS